MKPLPENNDEYWEFSEVNTTDSNNDYCSHDWRINWDKRYVSCIHCEFHYSFKAEDVHYTKDIGNKAHGFIRLGKICVEF